MQTIGFLNSDAFRVIEAVLEKNYHLRELAEKLELPPSSAHNITKRLLAEKIITTKKQKNRKLLSLNYDSPIARELLMLIFTKKILDSRPFKKLVAQKPNCICLFGTAASGRLTRDSDIDLAVYFDKKPNTILLSKIKREMSNELKREVQLIILTKEKIASMKREGVELLGRIKGASITLWGEELE